MKRLKITFTLAFLVLAAASFAGNSLFVKGQVLDPLNDVSSITLEVIVNGGAVHEIPLNKKAKFEVKIYEDDIYIFQFKREGYVTKTIVVDTTAPSDILLHGTIEFDVQMERKARKMAAEKFCAIFSWSHSDQALVHRIPDTDHDLVAYKH